MPIEKWTPVTAQCQSPMGRPPAFFISDQRELMMKIIAPVVEKINDNKVVNEIVGNEFNSFDDCYSLYDVRTKIEGYKKDQVKVNLILKDCVRMPTEPDEENIPDLETKEGRASMLTEDYHEKEWKRKLSIQVLTVKDTTVDIRTVSRVGSDEICKGENLSDASSIPGYVHGEFSDPERGDESCEDSEPTARRFSVARPLSKRRRRQKTLHPPTEKRKQMARTFKIKYGCVYDRKMYQRNYRKSRYESESRVPVGFSGKRTFKSWSRKLRYEERIQTAARIKSLRKSDIWRRVLQRVSDKIEPPSENVFRMKSDDPVLGGRTQSIGRLVKKFKDSYPLADSEQGGRGVAKPYLEMIVGEKTEGMATRCAVKLRTNKIYKTYFLEIEKVPRPEPQVDYDKREMAALPPRVDHEEPKNDCGECNYRAIARKFGLPLSSRVINTLSDECMDMGVGIGEEEYMLLARVIRYGKHLNALILDGTPITKRVAFAIGHTLSRSPTIRTLSAKHCNIDDDCLGQMGRGLRVSRSLAVLDLGSNNFTDSGLWYLSYSVGRNRSLRELSLASNNLTSGAFPPLCTMLKRNCFIVALDLSDNDMNDHLGFKRLISTMSDDHFIIESLNMSSNQIEPFEMGSSIRMMETLPKLHELDFSYNSLTGEEIMGHFNFLLRHHEALTYLNLSYNPLTVADVQLLIEELPEESHLLVIDIHNIFVDKVIKEVSKAYRVRQDLDVRYAGVHDDFEVEEEPNLTEFWYKRAHHLTKTQPPAKRHLDLGVYLGMLKFELEQIGKELRPIRMGRFVETVADILTYLEPSLLKELFLPFAEGKKVDLEKVLAYYQALFPESKINLQLAIKKKLKLKRKQERALATAAAAKPKPK